MPTTPKGNRSNTSYQSDTNKNRSRSIENLKRNSQFSPRQSNQQPQSRHMQSSSSEPHLNNSRQTRSDEVSDVTDDSDNE